MLNVKFIFNKKYTHFYYYIYLHKLHVPYKYIVVELLKTKVWPMPDLK